MQIFCLLTQIKQEWHNEDEDRGKGRKRGKEEEKRNPRFPKIP
jgi:hypothetical protein